MKINSDGQFRYNEKNEKNCRDREEMDERKISYHIISLLGKYQCGVP